MSRKQTPDIKEFKVIRKKEKVPHKEYKVIKCYWHDIVTQGGWVENKEIPDLTTSNAITYGLLVEETDCYVKISASISLDDNPDFADVTVIPKTVVLAIKEIDKYNYDKEHDKATLLKKNKMIK